MVRALLLQLKYLGSKDITNTYVAKEIEKNSECDLVILPELHQSEYFCKKEDNKFFAYADSYPDDVRFWATIAKKYGVVLVTSLFEKSSVGSYYNSVVVFEKDGSVAGKYRKMHIPHDKGFYEKYYFTPADNPFVPIKTSIGSLGVLICWDQWFGEAARIMALNGAQILIYPTAIGYIKEDSKLDRKRYLDAWITVQRGHSIGNNLPLICVNRTGLEYDDSSEKNDITFWGNSFATDSMGSIITDAKDETVTLKVDIDLDETSQTRKIWPFFRDRRVSHYKDILRKD